MRDSKDEYWMTDIKNFTFEEFEKVKKFSITHCMTTEEKQEEKLFQLEKNNSII